MAYSYDVQIKTIHNIRVHVCIFRFIRTHLLCFFFKFYVYYLLTAVWVTRLPSTEHCDLESRKVYLYPCVPYTYVVTTYTTSRVSAYRFTRNPHTKATHSHGTAEGEINTPVQRYIKIGRVRAMAVKRGGDARSKTSRGRPGSDGFRDEKFARTFSGQTRCGLALWGHWSTTITPVPRGQ